MAAYSVSLVFLLLDVNACVFVCINFLDFFGYCSAVMLLLHHSIKFCEIIVIVSKCAMKVRIIFLKC